MSHIVEIQTEVRDPAAARAACARLRWPEPVLGTHQLYSGQFAGLGVQLPGQPQAGRVMQRGDNNDSENQEGRLSHWEASGVTAQGR